MGKTKVRIEVEIMFQNGIRNTQSSKVFLTWIPERCTKQSPALKRMANSGKTSLTLPIHCHEISQTTGEKKKRKEISK